MQGESRSVQGDSRSVLQLVTAAAPAAGWAAAHDHADLSAPSRWRRIQSGAASHRQWSAPTVTRQYDKQVKVQSSAVCIALRDRR